MQVRTNPSPNLIVFRPSGGDGPQRPQRPEPPQKPTPDTVEFTTTGLGTVTLAAFVAAPAIAGASYGGARFGAAGALLGIVGAVVATVAMDRSARQEYARSGQGTLFLEPKDPNDPNRINPNIRGLE